MLLLHGWCLQRIQGIRRGEDGTGKGGEELTAARTVGQSAHRFSFPLPIRQMPHTHTVLIRGTYLWHSRAFLTAQHWKKKKTQCNQVTWLLSSVPEGMSTSSSIIATNCMNLPKNLTPILYLIWKKKTSHEDLDLHVYGTEWEVRNKFRNDLKSRES